MRASSVIPELRGGAKVFDVVGPGRRGARSRRAISGTDGCPRTRPLGGIYGGCQRAADSPLSPIAIGLAAVFGILLVVPVGG